MGRNIAGCGSSVRLIVFSVFHNTHHLYARSIALLEISAHGVRYRAKDLARKLLVDHGHARRVLVVMPGEGPARQQDGACRVEVFGRYAEHEGVSGGIRRPQVCRFVGKDKRAVRPR